MKLKTTQLDLYCYTGHIMERNNGGMIEGHRLSVWKLILIFVFAKDSEIQTLPIR